LEEGFHEEWEDLTTDDRDCTDGQDRIVPESGSGVPAASTLKLVSAGGNGEIEVVPALVDILAAVSAAAFLFYGLACLFSPKLVAEFERYGLAGFRALVGSLEVVGALGLIAGWWFPPLQTAAAAGLAALMLCGLWARWRIRDPWYAMLPALVLGVVNLLIALRTAEMWMRS
jgi:hypothetical protein